MEHRVGESRFWLPSLLRPLRRNLSYGLATVAQAYIDWWFMSQSNAIGALGVALRRRTAENTTGFW